MYAIYVLGILWLSLAKGSGSADEPLRIHVVPHTHDDAGWLKTVDQYYVGSRQDIQLAGVQYILDTTVQCLSDNRNRTMVYAEMAFFTRWWKQQTPDMQQKVRALVDNGQLSFVNGGWVQHDEAAAHYVAMIDQTTRGHQFLLKEFNYTPSVAWQIDPFGHSSTQASLMTAKAGMDAVFFARSDYDDAERRRGSGASEMVWRPSGAAFCDAADVLAGNFPNHYGPPAGFNFEWGQHDPQIQDDPTLEDYNLPERVDAFLAAAAAYAATTRGRDVMFLMGTDFTYANAQVWYKNMDKLIAGVNGDGRATAFYSSPQRYVAAKASYGGPWPLRTDDFFPYADGPHTYWTGYFSSRPTHKGYIRSCTGYLNAARKLLALAHLQGACTSDQEAGGAALDKLEAAVSLTQHHDAISGTEKQHVANDYALRLAAGMASARPLVATLLSRLIFQPTSSWRSAPRAPDPAAIAAASAAAVAPAEEARGAPQRTARRLEAYAGADDGARASMAQRVLGSSAFAHGADLAEGQGPKQRPHSDATAGDGAAPELLHCELSNVTLCDASVEPSKTCSPIMLVLFNPMAWARTEGVQVPLGSSDCDYAVATAAGDAVAAAQLPLSPATWCLQQLMATLGMTTATSPVTVLAFRASVPPLGFTTFLLHARKAPVVRGAAVVLADRAGDVAPVSRAAASLAAARGCALCSALAKLESPLQAPPVLGPAAPAAPQSLTLENAALILTFDSISGRLEAITHKPSGTRTRVALDLTFWESRADAPPFGGAYIMRPGAQVPLAWPDGSSSATLELHTSDVVGEARLAFAGWGTMVVRLWAGAEEVEVEWTVGPIPVDDGIGKEVTLRVRSDVASGDLFETDANGRQMVVRRRSWRAGWPLANAEPVAGNFYPITAAVSLSGAVPGAAGNMTLGLVTDRAQAAASLEPGSLHVLLHRRLLQDDARGVDEHLNETMCGCRDCACPGLVARGTLHLVLAPTAPAALLLRTAAALANDPPVALYARGTEVLQWAARHARVAAARGDVQGVGATQTGAHPLARAILKEIGDNAVVPARLKALGDYGLAITRSAAGHVALDAVSTQALPAGGQHPWMQLAWSAAPARAAAGLGSGLPASVALVTLMPWLGMSGSQGDEAHYLIRLAHVGEEGGAAEVDLCQMLTWPRGAALRVTEWTVTVNQRLAGVQRTTFQAAERPICFKEVAADCAALSRGGVREDGTREGGCGEVQQPFDVDKLDCSQGSRPLRLRLLDVRTLVVSVLPGNV